MISSSYFKSFIAFAAVASLAGCLGLGSSGGGGAAVAPAAGAGAPAAGGAKTLNAFETAFNKTSGQIASTNRLTGTATYEGQVEVLTNANAANAKEAVFGDLKMDIDFGVATRPISGTVGNFEGEVDGMPVKINGTLSTANAKPTAANEITVNTFALPAPATGTVTQTGLAATFRGNLDDPSSKLSGEAEMTLLGTFSGPTGEGVFGSNGVMIQPATGAMFITGGRFYADRK